MDVSRLRRSTNMEDERWAALPRAERLRRYMAAQVAERGGEDISQEDMVTVPGGDPRTEAVVDRVIPNNFRPSEARDDAGLTPFVDMLMQILNGGQGAQHGWRMSVDRGGRFP